MTGEKRKRRKTILSKKFQIKYALMIGGALIFLLAISMLFTYFTIKPLFPNILSSQYAAQLKLLQIKLLVSGIIYIFIIVFSSLYISHKIAGPISRIEREIENLAENGLNYRLKIRKKDELHEFARVFNKLIESWQKKYESKK